MITETGIWSDDEKVYHVNSQDLLNSLKSILNPSEPVMDFGCGTGYYLTELSKSGFSTLIGFEGTSVPEQPGVTFNVFDLSKPIDIELIPGQVISFEVGEHIPKEFEETFINNLIKYCNSKLIISWALLGQVGLGHVNCQPLEYIINQIEKRGFTYDAVLSEQTRSLPHTTTPWFNNTIMIFNKK